MIVVSIFVFIFALLIIYLKIKYNYWRDIGIPSPNTVIPFGNIDYSRKRNMGLILSDFYQNAKNNKQDHLGLYVLNVPLYLPVNIDLIKSILITDFAHFSDRGTYHNAKNEPLTANIFTLNYDVWKELRAVITPAFKKVYINELISIFNNGKQDFLRAVDKVCLNKVDLFDLLSKHIVNATGLHAFGIDCQCFQQTDFLNHLNRAIETNISIWMIIGMLFPKFVHFFKIKRMDKQVNDFFTKFAKDCVNYRQNNIIKRIDFLQVLMDNGSLTLNEISAQIFTYFLASFETTTGTVTYALYEMAKNFDIQNNARNEIDKVVNKYGNEITYNALKEMKYLELVIKETGRKYPIAPMLNRACINNYNIPGTDLILEKGVKVFISVYGIHHDPEFYPAPEVFDPTRFEATENLPFFAFGDGPRNCVGMFRPY